MKISERFIFALAVATLPFAASPARAQDKPGDKLEKDKNAGTVGQQERSYLADEYWKAGKRLFDDMRYREAAVQLRLAVKMNPAHAEALKLLDETLYILGDKEAGYKDETRRYITDREVNIQQASMEVERVYAEGLRAMERQEFPTAIERFERVIETVRWFPYNIDKSGLKAQAEQKMAEAKEKEAERAALLREQEQHAAREDAIILEKRQLAYQEARIRQLFEQAEAAYDRTDYSKSERLCLTILETDPQNDKAEKLRARAAGARRFKAELYMIESGIEEMKRLIEGVYEAAIPYQEIFRFPGDAEWALVQKRAVDIEAAALRSSQEESPAELKIREVLSSRKVSVLFKDHSFEDAINYLRDVTGLNFVVGQAAQEQLSSSPTPITVRLHDIKLENALKIILDSEKLIYKIKNDSIFINTKDAEKADLILRFYEVSEIVNDLQDYPAPKIALQHQGSGAGAAAGPLIDLTEGEPVKPGIASDKLKELIDQKIGEEGEGSVDFMGGLLMVRKSLEAHKRIEKLLESLRRTTGVMVTVETRIIDIQDNFLEEVGVDFRGLPSIISSIVNQGPLPQQKTGSTGGNWTNKSQDVDLRAKTLNVLSQGLGSAASTPFNISDIGGGVFQYNVLNDFQLQMIIDAVKKKQLAKEIDAPRITAFNSQRSHVLAMTEKAYIADADVNQTGVTPTLKPVIRVLNTGSMLEARPIVSFDRRFVTLEVQPSLANHIASVKQRIQLNDNGNGPNTDITIELPVVTLSEIRSTVMVPDGGTVILGGLKNFLEQKARAYVPIVGDVPIFKNLFQRQGSADLKRSVIVLLKCDITIAREEEARRFNKQAPITPQIQ